MTPSAAARPPRKRPAPAPDAVSAAPVDAGAPTGDDAGAPATESLRDRRRREKDNVSRAHILDAAERVFGEKGFHSATLKEVADQAEFSVGALYAFFEGKDDLFAQVLERQGRALLDSMELAVQGGATPRDHLHRVADASIDYFRVRPDFYRVFQRELGGATWALRASLNQAGFARYREVMSFEERIFAAGVADGQFRPDDPEIMAALFSGLVQAYIAQWVFGLEADGGSRIDTVYPVQHLHELIDRAFCI